MYYSLVVFFQLIYLIVFPVATHGMFASNTEVNLEIDREFRRYPFQFQIPRFVYATIKSARELATSLQASLLF
jgi:hypothetical protein